MPKCQITVKSLSNHCQINNNNKNKLRQSKRKTKTDFGQYKTLISNISIDLI